MAKIVCVLHQDEKGWAGLRDKEILRFWKCGFQKDDMIDGWKRPSEPYRSPFFKDSCTLLFSRWYLHLHAQPLLLSKLVGERFASMAFGMFAQMIGAGKRFRAKRALEGSLARVQTHVTRQFVGTLEFFIAGGPSTYIGRFTRVRSHVRG